MENDCDSNESYRVIWQTLVKISSFLIVLYEHHFVKPVEHSESYAAEDVQHWKATRKEQNAEEIGVVLSIHEMALDLISSV